MVLFKEIMEFDKIIERANLKLKNTPFSFLKEAEFQAYLYHELIEENYGFCKNSEGLENYRVHLEYPRYRNNKRKGRWDIVILKPDRYENDDFDKALRRHYPSDKKNMKGIIVAFSFTKGAYIEVDRAKREDNIEIQLIIADELIG